MHLDHDFVSVGHVSSDENPQITTDNGHTAIDYLISNDVPTKTVDRLLNAGWHADYQYRLYVGAKLDNVEIIQDAIDHGADVTQQGLLQEALMRPFFKLSYPTQETEQQNSLVAVDLLLKHGATIDEGDQVTNAGDVYKYFSYWGKDQDFKPVLDLLVRYLSPGGRQTAMYWVGLTKSKGQERRDWLLKRLQE